MSGGQLDRTTFAVALPHALRILLALLECAGAVAFVRPAAQVRCRWHRPLEWGARMLVNVVWSLKGPS